MTPLDDLQMVRLERDLHAHVELFKQHVNIHEQHVQDDNEAFHALEAQMEKIESQMDARFDKLELILTELRLHTARREGGEDAIKKVAGYISGLVAAAVSALGVLVQKLFLE
jgi:hypothetical protein